MNLEKQIIEKLTNPNDTWEIDTIKLWLDSKQTKSEGGSVVVDGKQEEDDIGEVPADDPYIYEDVATKAELLEIANPEAQLN